MNNIHIDADIHPRIYFYERTSDIIQRQAKINLEALADEWWDKEGKNKFMDFLSLKDLQTNFPT